MKRPSGKLWQRALLCTVVAGIIVLAAFAFGGACAAFLHFCFHAYTRFQPHREPHPPNDPSPVAYRAGTFAHIAKEHDEIIDTFYRRAPGGFEAAELADQTEDIAPNFDAEREAVEDSQSSLEEADADEAENGEDGIHGAEDTPTADHDPESFTEPVASDVDLASARCGGQPASMIPYPSASNVRHRRLLRRTLSLDDSLQSSSVWMGLEANGNKTDFVSEAAIDLSEVYTRREQPTSWNRRTLLHRSIGFTTGKAGCGKELTVRVEHENDGAGPIPRKLVRSGEETLAACLQRPNECDDKAQAAGRRLPGLAALRRVPKVQLSGLLAKGKMFKSCAIVGNAGHLNGAEYGKYIDNHEAVIRFNILPVAGFEKHIGTKTTLRMLNNRRSVALCCRGNFPEGRAGRTNVAETGVMIWFPEAQGEILGACKRRFPSNPRFAIPMSVNKAMAEAMRKMRSDATRLGLGPFHQWRQMTSGAHAVLLFSQLCDRVSLYGMTTFGGTKGGPDQYAGRAERARSGSIWHDWGGEKGVWKLMHAAGVVDVCSA